MTQWHFEQDEHEQWHWKLTQLEDETASARSFSSAAECMLDAVRHAVERRRTLEIMHNQDTLQ